MGDSRIQQFVPVKRVGTVITPKVSGDSISFQQFRPQINVETLSATRTLLTTDYMAQWLDPNGSDRDVTLPAEADSTNLLFIILNTANATGEDLVIKNDAPATITTIGPNQSAMLACDGTNWKLESDVGMYYDGQAAVNEMGYKLTGGVVISDYLTVGQAVLNTTYPLTVAGNTYLNGALNISGNILALINDAGISINIPVAGTSSIDHAISLQIDENILLKAIGTGDGAGGITAARGIIIPDYLTVGLAALNTTAPLYVMGDAVVIGEFKTNQIIVGEGMTHHDNNALSMPFNINIISGTNNHAIKLQIDTNDIFAVRATGQGDGSAADFIALLGQNDMWLAELNFTGNDYVNMFKVNPADGIDVGGSLALGSIEAEVDSGPITIMDMPVSAAPAVGDEQSFYFKLDGDNVFAYGAFADSAGGVGGHFIKFFGAQFEAKINMGAADYNPSALTNDRRITVDTTAAARNVIISTEDRDTGSPTDVRIFVIQDITGNAAVNNITVSLEGAGNINGAANFVINSNYGSIHLMVDGTDGFVD